MKNYRKTKLYKKMTSYIACSIVEEFSGEDNTQDEIGTAWQWLLDTGLCWKLQGFYGRTVMNLLKQGLLLPPIEDHEDYYGNVILGIK